MCRASLGSVVEGFEFTVEGRLRMEAERAMGHGRLMARAKGGGGLWLVRQRCRDGSEALLLKPRWRLLGFGDFECAFHIAFDGVW